MNEVSINTILYSISDYVTTSVLTRKELCKEDCIKYISENTKLSENIISNNFKQIIENEIVRTKKFQDTTDIDESVITDLTQLLNEADNTEVKKQVDAAAKTQTASTNSSAIDAQRGADKNLSGSHTRKYFAYVNLVKGEIYICSELQNNSGAVSNAFAKLSNFLATCVKPTFNHGILVAPITMEDARSYLASSNGKIKYLDLSKNTNN